MGKQSRIIAQKSKSKQHQSVKKAKAVKTNLKRLNEKVRDKVEQIDKLYEKSEKQEEKEPTKQDDQADKKSA